LALGTSLGIPNSILSSQSSTDANAQADALSFLTTTVLHECSTIQEALNAQLMAEQGLTFMFEPERHEVMQAVQQRQAQAAVSLYVAGVTTLDETRATLGLPPMEVTAQATPEAPEPPEPEDEEPEAEEDDMAARGLDLRRWRSKVERRGRAVKFTPEALGEDEAEVIRERLLSGVPIATAFDPPFRSSF
jgi:hypothetical protein